MLETILYINEVALVGALSHMSTHEHIHVFVHVASS